MQSVMIILLLNVFQISIFIFSAELHAWYLALNRVVEMADDDKRNFIFFSDSKSAFQAIWGWRLDSLSCPQDTGMPSISSLASTTLRENNIILLFPVILAEVMTT